MREAPSLDGWMLLVDAIAHLDLTFDEFVKLLGKGAFKTIHKVSGHTCIHTWPYLVTVAEVDEVRSRIERGEFPEIGLWEDDDPWVSRTVHVAGCKCLSSQIPTTAPTTAHVAEVPVERELVTLEGMPTYEEASQWGVRALRREARIRKLGSNRRIGAMSKPEVLELLYRPTS